MFLKENVHESELRTSVLNHSVLVDWDENVQTTRFVFDREEDWAQCLQPLKEFEVDVGLGSNYLMKYSFSKRDQLLA